MADGQIVFEITADGKKAIASVNDVTAAIQKASKNWDASAKEASNGMADAFGGAMKKITAGITAAAIGKKLFDFGKAAIDAASDLQEVQNVVDVTFGDASKQIDAWAKNAISQFGLTETKAKQFASTLGAMMKSAGMAGPEIVEMSENLAGLAADMASFYNLDFDTAFQKIRSGISGETEPLKQLGINMSVANLEAFALQQGLKKTFDQMSQGEQTMLRYQYIMQATSDAQGDFARTSEGFANSKRLLESNLESIKTTVGNAIIPALASATTAFNEFLSKITQSKPRTVLDDFNDINIETESKIQEITKTEEAAKRLILTLQDVDNTDPGKAMKAIAEGANVLNANAPGTWSSLMGALESVDGLSNIFSNTKAGKNVEDLAKALSGASPDVDRAEAWQIFLDALGSNVDALTALTGTSADETAAWLETIADAASKIKPSDVDAWNKLLGDVVAGLPELANTEGGKAFFDALAQNFLAMGSESDEAKKGLAALGWSTDQISDKQKVWLETCKRLVQTIPGLSEIINAQTGEVKGGTDAIKAYVQAWKDGQLEIAFSNALEKKRTAYAQAIAEMADITMDLKINTPAYNDVMNKLEQLKQAAIAAGATFDEDGAVVGLGKNESAVDEIDAYYAFIDANADVINKQKELEKALEDSGKAANKAADDLAEAEKIFSDFNKTAKNTAESTKEAGVAISESFTPEKGLEGIQKAHDALKAINDYTKSVYKNTYSSLENSLGGLSRFISPAEEARGKVKSLNNEIAELKKQGKDTLTLSTNVDELNRSIPTIANVTENLKSQITAMQDYYDNINKMKAAGYSADMLSMVMGGTAQDMDTARELAQAGKNDPRVTMLNDLLEQRKQLQAELSAEMAANKLTVDETMNGLVDDWNAAIGELDQYTAAHDNAANTVRGITDALGEGAEAVRSQVDSILAMISELSGASYGINLSGITPDVPNPGGGTTVVVNPTINMDGKSVTKEVSGIQYNQFVNAERSGIKFDIDGVR